MGLNSRPNNLKPTTLTIKPTPGSQTKSVLILTDHWLGSSTDSAIFLFQITATPFLLQVQWPQKNTFIIIILKLPQTSPFKFTYLQDSSSFLLHLSITANFPWFIDITFHLPIPWTFEMLRVRLSVLATSATGFHCGFDPSPSYLPVLLIKILCSSPVAIFGWSITACAVPRLDFKWVSRLLALVVGC